MIADTRRAAAVMVWVVVGVKWLSGTAAAVSREGAVPSRCEQPEHLLNAVRVEDARLV